MKGVFWQKQSWFSTSTGCTAVPATRTSTLTSIWSEWAVVTVPDVAWLACASGIETKSIHKRKTAASNLFLALVKRRRITRFVHSCERCIPSSVVFVRGNILIGVVLKYVYWKKTVYFGNTLGHRWRKVKGIVAIPGVFGSTSATRGRATSTTIGCPTDFLKRQSF